MHYIVRYSEIALKGKNRWGFVTCLTKNILAAAKETNVTVLSSSMHHSRIVIETTAHFPALKRVFGIHSYSVSTKLPKDIESVKQYALEHFVLGKTFAVKTKRVDKTFSMTSQEISQTVGGALHELHGTPVNLKQPQSCLYVEILEDGAYVSTEELPGPGGLPVGCQGNVAAIMEDETSLLAALLMLKRGCSVFPIGATPEQAAFLRKYSYGAACTVHTLDAAKKQGIKAVVSMDFSDPDVPTLNPLVGFSEEEIKRRLEAYRVKL